MHPDVIRQRSGNCPKCGMALVPLPAINSGKHPESHLTNDFRSRFLFTLPAVILTLLLSPDIQNWFHLSIQLPFQAFLTPVLAFYIFIVGGKPFFTGAKSELQAHRPAMMTLVSLAIIVGFTFSVAASQFFAAQSLYWEVATLISVFLLGHWLEMRAVHQTTVTLADLAQLLPSTAHVLRDQHIIDLSIADLKVNDLVLVRPGEKIPADGIVVDGQSMVNESLITGESRPIDKQPGDQLVGGSLNQDGALTVKTTRVGQDITAAQIIQLVFLAQSFRPSVQNLADQAAGWLFYLAVTVSVGALLFWLFVIPQNLIFAVTIAVSVIVVACPHALGLAIPVVTTVTSRVAARNGILIKDIRTLDLARQLDYVVFDKTGTLTTGGFSVSKIEPFDPHYSSDRLLQLAASVETRSQHSLARGIVDSAKTHPYPLLPVVNFRNFPGKGVTAMVDGISLTVGNQAMMDQSKITVPEQPPTPTTAVYLAVNHKLAGIIYLSDTIRPESRITIDKLHHLGIKVAMLTGDSNAIAEQVARQLKIDTVFAEVLPSDKADKISHLQSQNYTVAMVGDGINDAPSLAQADVSIAVASGTDIAQAASSIILLQNRPSDVLKIITLSRETQIKMIQNLVWATGYNLFALPLAAGLLYPSFGILLRPEWSALLMSLSSLIVVFNALSLNRAKL